SSENVWLYRESPELDRWSPMTHSSPSGTTSSNWVCEGALPSLRYSSSSSGSPLTVIAPLSSQHTTWSPPRPMTRLIRYPSESSGTTPMNSKTLLKASPTPPLDSDSLGGSQPPGSLKTTTSPRSTSPKVKLIL